jgi:hypothetical protein
MSYYTDDRDCCGKLSWTAKPWIRAADLFDGRLEQFGVREYFGEKLKDHHRALTDGRNIFTVHVDQEGFVSWVYLSDASVPEPVAPSGGDQVYVSVFGDRPDGYAEIFHGGRTPGPHPNSGCLI